MKSPLEVALALARPLCRAAYFPICNQVQLAASGGRVTLRATDLLAWLQCDAGTTESAWGPVLADPSALLLLAKGEGTLAYEPGNFPAHGKLRLGGGAVPASAIVEDLPAVPPELEWELGPAGKYLLPANTPARELAAIFAAALPAASDDETRPHLCALQLERFGRELRAACTDGHRLHYAALPLEDYGAGDGEKVLLRAEHARLFLAVLRAAPKGALAQLALAGDHVRLSVSGTVVLARRLEEQFPPYRKIVPKKHAASAAVEVAPLLAVLRRAAEVMRGMRNRGAMLSLADGALRVRAENPDRGEFAGEVPSCFTGAAKNTGVNVGYLMAALRGVTEVGAKTACLKFGLGDIDPVVVECRESPRVQFVAVVMPLRV